MNSRDEINSIFIEPEQWGLRGDPFLWKELQDHFLTEGLPATTGCFTTVLEHTIRKLTGETLATDDPVFIQRYDKGGMSSGHIAPDWWRTTGIPLLENRFLTRFQVANRNLQPRLGDSRTQLMIKGAIQSKLMSKVALDDKGYVNRPEQNLIPDVRMEYFEQDLREGDGNELQTKFRAAHSSTALAVNCFAWFRANDRLQHLSILNKSGARDLRFERRFPIFRGGTAPNLDVRIDYDREIIAVESKLSEYFQRTKPEFTEAYERLAPPRLSEPCWWEVYQEAKKGEPSYLDRAQLLKHYFGLRKFQETKPFSGQVTLLYLYWEPTNAREIETCHRHRSELAEFEKSVASSTVKFCSMSYPELWNAWQAIPKLDEHVRHLRERYEMKVDLE
jgi:hypothetical protein